MNDAIKFSEYRDWLRELKQQIRTGQIKAALSVNSQMIMLYWDLGRQITEKQKNAKWGSGFIEQLSKDLRDEFPEMTGFSYDNLRWGHHILILKKIKDINQALFYINKTIENNWSRAVRRHCGPGPRHCGLDPRHCGLDPQSQKERRMVA